MPDLGAIARSVILGYSIAKPAKTAGSARGGSYGTDVIAVRGMSKTGNIGSFILPVTVTDLVNQIRQGPIRTWIVGIFSVGSHFVFSRNGNAQTHSRNGDLISSRDGIGVTKTR